MIITSPLTERVPGIKWLGNEVDGVNNEWIYTFAPPIRHRGMHRDTFTLYIERLLQTCEQTVVVFMENVAVYSENRTGHEYRSFKC